tara:strand:- start:391 stop:2199 length:1809 start_codon:yes stop_codon:yes gene_type:complete
MYIIAEVGINHDGDSEAAQKLIKGAFDAGANAIKFQYRNLSRAYSDGADELGDTMLKSEIIKNFISTDTIKELVKFAKNIGLDAGISFFSWEDYFDFSYHEMFDFYKIPSVEFQNEALMSGLLDTGKPVYASLGCQSESSIEFILGKYKKYENLTVLHCVSNYPVLPHNSKIGYITYFKNKFGINIGYSSHEEDWRLVLAAVALGATVIERHITLGGREGLDESTSSTVDDFTEMVQMCNNVQVAVKGIGPKMLNQGELLNKQNLGRSFYAQTDFNVGDTVKTNALRYASPATGLMAEDIENYISLPIIRDVTAGEVMVKSMFVQPNVIGQLERRFCIDNNVALPVRLHDVELIRSAFGVENYEYHLSYSEVDNGLDEVNILSNEKYSIHLPDYIGALHLIDPFGQDDIRQRSLFIINSVNNFAKKIEDKTGKCCPIVGSFSVVGHNGKDEFYQNIADLCSSLKAQGLSMHPQWLPPIAWYFGGSVPLNVFNSHDDITPIRKLDIPICFDSSHFLMCAHDNRVNLESNLTDLLKMSKHVHISGADGIDGEGTPFANMDSNSLHVIRECMKHDTLKVIETWQGHLDDFVGFHESIHALSKIGV